MNDLDMSSARQAIAYGKRAEAELELTRGAFERLRKLAMDEIINSEVSQSALRERMIVTCQILDAVKKSLELAVENGEASILTIAAYEKLETER